MRCSGLSGAWCHFLAVSFDLTFTQLSFDEGHWVFISHRGVEEEIGPLCKHPSCSFGVSKSFYWPSLFTDVCADLGRTKPRSAT